MVIKGAINGEAFLAYIERCPVPSLKRRDVVVIDNVPFHKAPPRTGGDRGWRRNTALPAAVFSGLQSNRDGFSSAEDIPAQSCGADNRRVTAMCPVVHSGARPLRMYRLFHARGLRTMIGTCCSRDFMSTVVIASCANVSDTIKNIAI
jgi:hypothetical protein